MMDLLERLRSAEKMDEEEIGNFAREAMLDAAEEIERLMEIIRTRGQHADVCDFYGECHCELKEFQLGA